MRPIDADACPKLFDEEFKETQRLILDGEKHLDNLAEGFMEANNVIRSMPTIDAAPVVHGRWIPYENEQDKGFHFCSVCKAQAFNYEDCGEVVEVLPNYCHNCGAKMDLPEDGE